MTGKPDAIEAEASLWLARRREASATDEAAFQSWLAADRRHRDAYGRMERTLADISSLSVLAELEPLQLPGRRSRGRAGLGRVARWAAPALGAAAALLAAVMVLPPMFAARPMVVSTALGEIRHVTLKDGTAVSLAPGSTIRARGREVDLAQGEAFFEVIHDPSRPFTVRAGDTVIRDIGTKFEVVRIGEHVRVSVIEGSVQVRHGSGRRLTERTLVRGQGAETGRGPAPAAAAAPAQIFVRAASPTAGSWRTGRLYYDDARLGDIVADLNRYYRPGVRLQDPALARKRVAASFKVDEIGTFLADLPKALPVTVSQDARGATVIEPAAASSKSS